MGEKKVISAIYDKCMFDDNVFLLQLKPPHSVSDRCLSFRSSPVPCDRSDVFTKRLQEHTTTVGIFLHLYNSQAMPRRRRQSNAET